MTEKKVVRYEYIDALRGWAILGVIATHVVALNSSVIGTKIDDIIEAFMISGLYGVQLFFVISAFTVFYSFKRTVSSDAKHAIKAFLIKRLFRIIPVYYIGILLIVITTSSYSLKAVLANMFFIHDFIPQYMNLVGGGWSIGVEVTFYLCVPIIWKYVNSLDKSLKLLFIGMFLHSFCTYFIRDLPLGESFLYRYFPSQFPIFCMGMSYYFFINGDREIKPPTLLLLATYIFVYFATQTFLQFSSHYFFCIGFVMLLYVLSQKPYIFFVNPLTIFFGKISYSLYLFHFFVLHLITEYQFYNFLSSPKFLLVSWNNILNFFVLTALSTLIAYVSYLFVEQPTIKLGHRFANRQ
ncbi:acyltransferase [Bernardetia sp. ABR2-2B]|uniref:acyltransferase family protein n=1 Tax=Bernardetia sp. ABR2-2B TaxID=3127472 RepID=UPI0030CC356B